MASEFDFLDSVGSERGNSKAAPNTLASVFERYGKAFVDSAKKNLLQHIPDSDSGKLYQSISFDVEIVGSMFRFTINMEEYWQYVNDGRRPGTPPPIKPIIEWLQHKPTVASKFGITRKKTKDLKVKTFQGLSVKTPLLSAAFAISKSIGKKGTKATNFFSDTVTDTAIERFKKDISSVIGKSIEINIASNVNNDNSKSKGIYTGL